MPVVLVVGIIAILVGVFVVSTGRGGELAYEQADHAPLDLGPVSATDVALLRPPTALWGYNMQVTDEAMDRIARALRDRDIQIAYLQRQLADLGQPQPGLAGLDQPGLTGEDMTQPKRFVPKHERPRPGSALDPDLASAASEPWPVADRPSEDQAASQASEDQAREDQAREEHTSEEHTSEGQAPTAAQSQPDEAEAEDESDSIAAAEEQGW